MTGGVLLLGSTDVTLAVAEAVLEQGASLTGIVSASTQFSISYSKTPIVNQRAVDLEGFSREAGIPYLRFDGYESVPDTLIASSDLCLVAGWYHIVPRAFRLRFAKGCLGLHASLLPQLRGGAPLNWAIISGLEKTGVTLFELSDGVDDGLVLGMQEIPIGPRDGVSILIERSRDACRSLIMDCLNDILAGERKGRPQVGTPTYCLQRTPEDGRIDWSRTAETVDRLIRAAGRPYGGAYTYLEGDKITLWQACPFNGPEILGIPGQIARVPDICLPLVVTGQGTLVIEQAQNVDGSDALPRLMKSAHKRFSQS